MLLGVIVGLEVTVGWGVLLGEGVADGVRVALGITFVAAGVLLVATLTVFSTVGLQPLINKNRSKPKVIAAITLSKNSLFPKYIFMVAGWFLSRQLYAIHRVVLSNSRI